MTMLYPIVLETEDNGAVSAYVPGLPVYAAADSHAKAERAIRAVLAAYLAAHPDSRPEARVRVARVRGGSQDEHQRRERCGAGGRQAQCGEGRGLACQWRLGGRPRKSPSGRAARAKASR